MPARRDQRWREADARNSRAVDLALRRLARRLRALRRGRGWTQEQVAERAHIDPKHYQALESGLSNVTMARLVALARAHGLTLSELLDGV